MSEERIPTESQCLEFLKRMGCTPNIIEHCIFVKEIAIDLAKRCKAHVNLELVIAGALLHDIGRSVTHNVAHGVIGGKIVRELGLSEAVARIVERHVGGGITAEEARNLGLPERDYIPETLEEKIVCIADKLVAHNRRTKIEVEIAKLQEKHLNTAAERVRALYTELAGYGCVDLE